MRNLVLYSSVSPAQCGVFASAVMHCAVGLWLISAPAAPPPLAVSFAVEVQVMVAASHDVAAQSSELVTPARQTQEVQSLPPSGAGKALKIEKTRHEPTVKTTARLAPSSRAQQAVIAPLTPALFNGGYVHTPAPHYPESSRRRNEEGKVMLSVFVRENGEPGEVRVLHSSGFAGLDEAALEAVKTWRFAPAHREARVMAAWVDVPVSFKLDGR